MLTKRADYSHKKRDYLISSLVLLHLRHPTGFFPARQASSTLTQFPLSDKTLEERLKKMIEDKQEKEKEVIKKEWKGLVQVIKTHKW